MLLVGVVEFQGLRDPRLGVLPPLAKDEARVKTISGTVTISSASSG